MSLIAELRRRNVIRTALFYLAGSWLLIQVAETIFPLFDLADSAARMVVIIMAIGFLMVRDLFHNVSLVWISGFRFLMATLALALLVLPGKKRSLLWLGFQKPQTWGGMIPMAILGPFLAQGLGRTG